MQYNEYIKLQELMDEAETEYNQKSYFLAIIINNGYKPEHASTYNLEFGSDTVYFNWANDRYGTYDKVSTEIQIPAEMLEEDINELRKRAMELQQEYKEKITAQKQLEAKYVEDNIRMFELKELERLKAKYEPTK
jgi:hypothetical protein